MTTASIIILGKADERIHGILDNLVALVVGWQSLAFLLAEGVEDKVDEAYDDEDVDQVPDGAAQGYLEEGLEEQGQGGKEETQTLALEAEVVVGQITKGSCRGETHYLAEAVGQIGEAEQQQNGYAYLDHGGNLALFHIRGVVLGLGQQVNESTSLRVYKSTSQQVYESTRLRLGLGYSIQCLA